MSEKMYSLNEIAEMTGTTIRTLRTDMQKGWLTGTMTEGKWEFSEEDLNRYFGNSEVRKRIRIKGNAPAYDFLDALGCEKPETCAIYDVEDREIAEQKNALLFERMKAHSHGNCGYTYYYDEEKMCGRFVVLGSIHYVLGVMELLK